MSAKTKKRRSSREDGRRIIAGIAAASLVIFLGSTVYFTSVTDAKAAPVYVYASPSSDLSPMQWKKYPASAATHTSLVDEATCNNLTDYINAPTSTIGIYDSFRIPLSSVPNGKRITQVDIVLCAKKDILGGTSTVSTTHRFSGGAWAAFRKTNVSWNTFRNSTSTWTTSYAKNSLSTFDIKVGATGTASTTVSSIRVRFGY